MAFLPDTNVWTHGLTLVSADKGFSRVPGLSVEDWA